MPVAQQPTYAGINGPRTGSIIPTSSPLEPTATQLAARTAAVTPPDQSTLKSPTVVTDATFREDTKPKLDRRMNALTGVPVTPLSANPDGNGDWMDNGATYDNAPQYFDDPKQNELVASMMQSTDAQTRQTLAAIGQQAAVRKAQQEMVNKNQEKATERSLLLGGAGRYAPLDANGINGVKETLGVQELASLDAQEQTAIANAKSAQQAQKYDLMDKALTEAENIRQEKQTRAQKLQDDMAAQNKAAQDQQMQASRDGAIAGLLAQGITDPSKILNYLNYDDNGKLTGDFTAKEVNDALANLNPQQKAVTDILDTARNNGAPADVLAKIGSATSLNDAYSAAGSYGAGGTGVIGEYNYAKANGYTGTFEEYQNEDANRKAKATGNGDGVGTIDLTVLPADVQAKLKSSGFTSLSSGVQDLATQLVNGQIAPSELSKRTTGTTSYSDVLTAANLYSQSVNGTTFNISKADRDYKYANAPATQNTLNYLSSLVGSKNTDGSYDGGNLTDLVNLSNSIDRSNFPALNDATQWAKLSTGDPQIAAYYTTMLEVSDQVAKILQGGGSGSGTSDAKLAQAAALFQKGFSKDQVKAVAGSLIPLLSNRAKGMLRDNPYLSDYASDFGIEQNLPGATQPTSNADDIVQTDQQAIQKIADFGKQPKNQALLDDLHAQFPDKSASWIATKLKI